MAYEYFANFYDVMMNDIPYEKYIELVKKYAEKTDVIIDIACGSGTIPIALKKDGYTISGADLSEEMLIIAKENAAKENINIDFYTQDMKESLTLKNIDMITTFTDSVNYLLDIEEVKFYFNEVYNSLKQDGYFIFDVHSIYRVNELYGDNIFFEDLEDFTYIWTTELTNNSNEVIHDLTIFKKLENDNYIRYDESHIQRTFKVSEYTDILNELGFKIKLLYDFDEEENNQAQKIIFICQK